MLLNLLEYHWAEDIDDALLLLARTDTRTVPLAGGTYLLGLQDDTIQAVVDLRDLELAYIAEDTRGDGNGIVRIGAMTTLQSMVDDPLLKDLAGGLLSRAALASSFSRLIRNSATLGGTLGAGIASQADLLTALAVLDAEIVLRSASKTQVDLSGGTAEYPGLPLSGVTYKGKQERRVPLTFVGADLSSPAPTASVGPDLSRPTPIYRPVVDLRPNEPAPVGADLSSPTPIYRPVVDLRPNELIIEVIVPRPGYTCGVSFMRVGRIPTDIALVNAAALVEVADGLYKQVRLALGGVNMEPVRLQAVEKQLAGQPVEAAGRPGDESVSLDTERLLAALHEGMTDFQPPSDFRASTDYRRVSGGNLAFRVLEEAANISRWRSMLSTEGRM